MKSGTLAKHLGISKNKSITFNTFDLFLDKASFIAVVLLESSSVSSLSDTKA